MAGGSAILMALTLTLCIAMLGSGMISIEDTRAAKPRQRRDIDDIRVIQGGESN